MTVGESPAVARHRLRLAVRDAREAKGFTQREVARALDWSLSKVNRIESGEVTLSRTDLLALLELLGVTDLDRVRELIDEARAARRRGWWDQPKYREHLTPAMIQSLQFETVASEIRSFQPMLIPGVLQIPEYMSAVIDVWNGELSAADVATRTEIRRWRREQLLNSPNSPMFLLVLDESVLLRPIGGPEVMSAQLYDLLDLVGSGRVTVRVAPLARVAIYAHDLFVIYTRDGEDLALYREGYLDDDLVATAGRVQRYRRIFERMWSEAMSVEASTRLVEARAAAMRSEMDRHSPAG